MLDQVWPPGRSPSSPQVSTLAGLVAGLDRALPLDLALTAVVQVALALPLLRMMSAADNTMASEVLQDARRGQSIVAVAVTEEDISGSALLDTATTLKSSEHKTVLRGRKAWITNATHADHVIVLARHRDARHFTSLCWALLSLPKSGTNARGVGRDLYPAAGLGYLEFDDVLVEEREVSRRGRALSDFVSAVSWERLAGAFWVRSLCQRVLRESLEHLRTRSTGTGTLWDNAVIQDRFTARVVAWRQLDALCQAPLADLSSTTAGMLLKSVAAETLDATLAECLMLRGGDALADQGLARLRSQASMFGIAGGATGVLRHGLAQHVPELLRGADPTAAASLMYANGPGDS
ncbi:acyl-CoA dehydrogenase family protein [Streptomyces sp. 7N604]|uniref:acyl-CoA dehydrogenase family protein n=1 Tax=Streptomyces sp. 7N604 TaxID=3457415 RepID=UPI003FD42985